MQQNDPTFAEPSGFASNSFAKGLAVLEAFDADSPCLSMAEIARRTGQDRATARRGVLTLEALGFLERKGRLFALSPKVLILAGNFLQASRLRSETLPILNHYAALLDTDLHLTTLFDNQVLQLCHTDQKSAEGHNAPEVGATCLPYNCSMGRVLLSSLPDEDLVQLLDTADIPRRTPHSLNSPSVVLERIQTARQAGYAFEYGEYTAGELGYAVPIKVESKRPLALGLRRSIDHAPNKPVEAYLEALWNCARELCVLPALSAF
ncbi:helix-turn-helix domain-containing protein [Epibacterium ulvae]|uniref:IclR family transcriptional regulator n=1 Tax=Epibacterium ulvae TaxID=1156985 RepID=UPI001BFCA2F1|nr:IclR family transcriptional regulator C-terminal domain-containing protein [Epibacterium ulvae]MBT8153935.1 helix-turn-helix domain-containing protein [Epibacterium ulvae]